MLILRFALLVFGITSVALAGFSSVPEIDSNTGVAGIVLLAGAVLVLRSRRGK